MSSVTSTKQHRSLQGTLRTILLKCRRRTPDDPSSTVGSGILRREPSLPILNNDSTSAFLLGVESIHYNDENDGHDIPDRFDISSLATSAAMSSTRTLMPKMSLSQFDAYHPPIQETIYLQRGRFDTVSSSLGEGASYQASLTSMGSFRSTSTLRIQSSSQSLRSESGWSGSQLSSPRMNGCTFEQPPQSSFSFYCPSPPRSTHSLSPKRSLKKRASCNSISSPSPLRQNLQPLFDLAPVAQPYPTPYDYSRRFSRPLSVIEEVASYIDEPPTPRQSPMPHFTDMNQPPIPEIFVPPTARSTSAKSDLTNPVLSVNQFSSFCALDTLIPGCPVTATSGDLKYIFEIGENFCLNNQGCDDVAMDIITGSDANGSQVTHLVLFSPLIIPHSGRSRFTLASMVDVTDFIRDAASLPELEMIPEELGEFDPPTPTSRLQPSPKTPKYQLSAESLLGGCFVEDFQTPDQKHDDDVWINLATEEHKQYSRQSKGCGCTRTPVSATSTLSSMDDVLDDFMYRLQELYSKFFLLAKSPLDDNYYEICNVSPKVYEDRDYVNGHLSKTSTTDMSLLSMRLAGDDPFDMEVRWGSQGLPKHLYCVPLFSRTAITWMCFLVDSGLPVLW